MIRVTSAAVTVAIEASVSAVDPSPVLSCTSNMTAHYDNLRQ